MKFGVNTFVFSAPFSTSQHLGLVDKVRDMGFDLLEVAIEDPALVDVAALRQAAQAAGIGIIVCGAYGPDRNLSSADAAIRKNADDYLKWSIEAAAKLESPVVAGPMYSAVGKARLETEAEREAEWGRAVEGLQKWGAYAEQHGVRLAFEPLNRFENDMINIIDQGLRLISDVGSPAVGLHLDTFHQHLEEKDTPAAIRRAGKYVFHFHACENDRGVPGTGQVNWSGVADALKDIQYDGAVVIESFTPEVKSIAKAVCIWREIAPSQDILASDGLAFLKELMA